MLATDEDTALKEFLDEDVPCEYQDESDGHAADVYATLVCPHCSNESTVWACCNECLVWARLLLARERNIICIECKVRIKPADMLTIKGPVR
jgi:hypothetical protein